MTIRISVSKVEQLAVSRKMNVEEVLKSVNFKCGEYIEFKSTGKLVRLANVLVMPISELVRDVSTDLTEGVKILRNNEGFCKVSNRGGNEYYTYKHLATSNSAPELMALKVVLHCESSENIVLNEGRSSKEVVYVLKGVVRVDWGNGLGAERRTEVLNEGDSIYLSPGVPHSFMGLELNSEILAFNYCLS